MKARIIGRPRQGRWSRCALAASVIDALERRVLLSAADWDPTFHAPDELPYAPGQEQEDRGMRLSVMLIAAAVLVSLTARPAQAYCPVRPSSPICRRASSARSLARALQWKISIARRCA